MSLDNLQDMWDNAVAASNEQSKPKASSTLTTKLTVPDGEHVGIIDKSGFVDKGDKQYVFWEVRYPSLGGSRTIYNDVAPNEMKLRILAGQFSSLGMKLQSPAQIPNAAKGCQGLKVTVRKVTKGAYENFYFKNVLEGTPVVPPPDTFGPITESSTDELPW